MSGLRAAKAGSARDAALRIEASFDPAEATKCLEWLKQITGADFNTDFGGDKYKTMNGFWNILKDGHILCRAVDACLPEGNKINFKKATFKFSGNMQFEAARERERIELYNQKLEELGVSPDNCFLVDCLYERTNLWQVAASIRALGTEFESRPSYTGVHWWPRKVAKCPRHFSQEVLNAGNAVINLQYGSNKGANQSGINFGKKRMIMKE